MIKSSKLTPLLLDCGAVGAGSWIAVVTSPTTPFVGKVLWNQLFFLALRTNVGRENVDFTYIRLQENV